MFKNVLYQQNKIKKSTSNFPLNTFSLNQHFVPASFWGGFTLQGCADICFSCSGQASLANCLVLLPPIKALQADAHESYNHS